MTTDSSGDGVLDSKGTRKEEKPGLKTGNTPDVNEKARDRAGFVEIRV
jgi:hypothetical protein